MENPTVQKLRETLAKNNNFAIVTGENPTIDEMAAALSFYLMLKNAGKKTTIVCPSDPIVELSSLVGINKVQKTLGGDPNDLVVSFPYVEGEIEKVSYTLEDGYLNIVVKAAQEELSFDEKDVKYMRGSGKIDVIIVIGTPRLNALGDLYNAEKFKDTKIINIDNKEENQGYGDVILVSPQLSSVSEQIADIALSLGFRVEKDIAQNLLNGISHATKNFQNPSTSPLAFEIASLLLKKGASRKRDESAREAAVPIPTRDDHRQLPQFTPKRDDNRHYQDQRLQPKQPRFQHDGRGYNQQFQNRNQSQDRNQFPLVEKNSTPEKTQIEEPVQTIRYESAPDQREEKNTPPIDWLTPKVYKGSSNF